VWYVLLYSHHALQVPVDIDGKSFECVFTPFEPPLARAQECFQRFSLSQEAVVAISKQLSTVQQWCENTCRLVLNSSRTQPRALRTSHQAAECLEEEEGEANALTTLSKNRMQRYVADPAAARFQYKLCQYQRQNRTERLIYSSDNTKATVHGHALRNYKVGIGGRLLRYVCAFTQALLEDRTLSHSSPGDYKIGIPTRRSM
jgi:hypothetical protein